MSAAAAASGPKTDADAERVKALQKELASLKSKAKQQAKIKAAEAKPQQVARPRTPSPKETKGSSPQPPTARPQTERVKDPFTEALMTIAGVQSNAELNKALHEQERFTIAPTRFKWVVACEAMGKIPKTQTLSFKLVKTTASADPSDGSYEVTIGDYHAYHTTAPGPSLVGYMTRKASDGSSQGYWITAESTPETTGFTWGLTGTDKKVSFQELVTAKAFSGFGKVQASSAAGTLSTVTCSDLIKKMKDARNGDVAAALDVAATIRVNEFLDLSYSMIKENKITALGRTAVIAYLSRGNQLAPTTTNLVVTDRAWN